MTNQPYDQDPEPHEPLEPDEEGDEEATTTPQPPDDEPAG